MKSKLIGLFLFLLFFSGQIFSTDFKSMVLLIDSSYDVRSAALDVEQSRGQIAALSHPGDVLFSLDPSVKVLTVDDDDVQFGEEVSLTGSASIKIPVGLSALEKEKLAFTQFDLKRKEEALEAARKATFISLYSMYQDIWLLQKEEEILKRELEAEELSYKAASERYALGSITIKALQDAGDSYDEKNEEMLQNSLEQRISWFKLKTVIELEEEPVSLSRIVLDIGELPKPPDLYDWLNTNHPLLKAEREKISQLEQTVDRLGKADLDLSVRAFFNSVNNTVTASVSYDFMNPLITPSVGFPIYTFGDIPSSSGGSATWNVGMSVSLGLGTGKTDKLTIEDLELEIQRSRYRLDYLSENVNLVLRSAYQQHVKNISSMDEALRNLDLSENNRKIVSARKELNQTSELDLLMSENAMQRSLWKIEAARIAMEKSWLNLLDSALKLDIESLNVREAEND
ncbi:TolC family protein [Spirochaeta isovalerica]|uniref:Outer membrane protein TolC n=1 Tax=Spirochaeta isovalerica TaxID=150 RepID=A0A841RDJ7_9SPIO|nr:TolC family protein [Spirochaeta isovalerica]MBB6481307.1 outer membrane protein TolC [Spirochaeta isovalerica]